MLVFVSLCTEWLAIYIPEMALNIQTRLDSDNDLSSAKSIYHTQVY